MRGKPGTDGQREEVGRPSYEDALAACLVLERLADFDARVAGTPPLGLDMPGSDIDVLCCAPDAHAFAAALWAAFGDRPGFTLTQWRDPPRPVVAAFDAAGWRIEVYGEAAPVERQPGWRHFAVERRLLALSGPRFRSAVLDLRRRGQKTEPAVAAALRLPGDPYLALLELGDQGDADLCAVLRAAGFTAISAHRP
jgi:hypothetical protein